MPTPCSPSRKRDAAVPTTEYERKCCKRCGEISINGHKHCQAVVESPTGTHEMCPNIAQFVIRGMNGNQSRRVCEAHVNYAINWLVIGPVTGRRVIKATPPIRKTGT